MGETKKKYDSTVARIAGNIASGLVSKADPNGAGLNGAAGVSEWARSVVLLSVGLARLIVEEVERTERGAGEHTAEKA
jgi:hypothetical protein